MNPTMMDLFALWSWISNESMPVPPPVVHDKRFFSPLTHGYWCEGEVTGQ
jgi:hypothetical protein